MDEIKKRDRPISDIDATENKRAKTPATEEDDDDVAFLLSVDADAFSVLQELLASPEKSIPAAAVTGNEESCGSSFSYRDSSMMASLDFAAVCGGAWGTEAARGGDVEVVVGGEGEGGSDGWDYSEEFDEMLARFLGEDVSELGKWGGKV